MTVPAAAATLICWWRKKNGVAHVLEPGGCEPPFCVGVPLVKFSRSLELLLLLLAVAAVASAQRPDSGTFAEPAGAAPVPAPVLLSGNTYSTSPFLAGLGFALESPAEKEGSGSRVTLRPLRMVERGVALPVSLSLTAPRIRAAQRNALEFVAALAFARAGFLSAPSTAPPFPFQS